MFSISISPLSSVACNIMLDSMASGNSIGGRSSLSNRAFNHPIRTLATNRSLQRQNVHCEARLKISCRRSRLKLFALLPEDSAINMSPGSPAHVVMLLYSSMNDRSLKRLDDLIAEDCVFEDYSFAKPLQGRKEVLRFLRQLVSCMGENMKFNVDHICEGSDYTTAVNWHLDWSDTQVPFTRGCSCYSFSMDTNDQLVIKKAQIMVESPIKLGVVALTLFKIVSSLFDANPAATEWFLNSPHIVFHLLVRAYDFAIKPVISPVLDWYIKLLNFAACILSFTLKLLYYLAKIFHHM